MDAIHSSGPVGWIPHPHVALVHVQAWEPAPRGSLSEDGAAVWIELDGADGRVSEDAVGEESPADPGEQVQRAHT